MTKDVYKRQTQNAEYSTNILKSRKYKQPLLVTSAFHMERAVVNFNKLGVDVIPYPCDYMVNKEKVFHYNRLAPSSQALEFTAIYLQENLRTFVTCLLYTSFTLKLSSKFV